MLYCKIKHFVLKYKYKNLANEIFEKISDDDERREKQMKKQKEKLKSNNAITLISLIITIIVLLILAVVSIKLIWSEGIIEHANNAVNAYNEAQTNEREQLNVLEEQIKQYNGNNWWNTTNQEKEILTNLKKNDESGVIAQNESGTSYIALYFTSEKEIGLVMCENQNENVLLLFVTKSIYTDNDAYKDSEELEEIKEINKWYTYGGSGLEQIDPYTGESPVKLSELTNIESGCEDLVKRIIESFN